MKIILMLTMSLTIATIAGVTTPAFAENVLSKNCSYELAKEANINDPQHIFVISDKGMISHVDPYGEKAMQITFPFPIAEITSEPKAITLVPYRGSLGTLVCWYDGMGHYTCIK